MTKTDNVVAVAQVREGDAARRWREDLDSWAIPPEILAAAPESPWGFPPGLFTRATEDALEKQEAAPTASFRRALEALPQGGSVLDVGAGGGAASLPLCPPAATVTAVDQSPQMLASFATLAAQKEIEHREVEGVWPDVADQVGVADVVVCNHVLYNVADLVPFVTALTEHARHRVVVEMTATHPQALLNPLWEHFHGIGRPTRPTADDAVAVLCDLGVEVGVEVFDGPLRWQEGHTDELIAFTRRRLCLPAERDPEVAAMLPPAVPRPHVAVWWAGRAG
jgi:SAM-dependent methyltransferase